MLAKHVSVCTVKCDFSTPHAVMKPYPPRGKESAYATVDEITKKGVRIVDGKITCISCHNLKNRTRLHLILDDKGKICLICHIRL